MSPSWSRTAGPSGRISVPAFPRVSAPESKPAQETVTPTTPNMPEQTPLLELRDVHKRFAGVTALRGVDLEIYPGEVVALVGDNGAGKSTLVKTISGAIPADEGEFLVEGRRVSLGTPHAAASLGIATVYQDLALCENLDVIQNLFLGAELGGGPFPGLLRRLREPAMQARARETLDRIAINVPNLD